MTRLRSYRVRNAAGEELVVPSLGVLHDLYDHGFLEDEDLVRADNATQWVRAGAFPALHGVRERKGDPRAMAALLFAAIALVAALALLLR